MPDVERFHRVSFGFSTLTKAQLTRTPRSVACPGLVGTVTVAFEPLPEEMTPEAERHDQVVR